MDQLPQDLIILIFSYIDVKKSIDDAINFIESSFIDIFNQGNTWRIIYNIVFKDIDLTIVTGINYTKKNYKYYLITYHGLVKNYISTLNIMLFHLNNDLDYPYNFVLYNCSSLEVIIKFHQTFEIMYQTLIKYQDHYIGYYSKNSEHFLTLKYGSYPNRLRSYQELKIKVTYKEMFTFLMFINYNNIKELDSY